MEANGGAFRVRISSAKLFGLIAYERSTAISLTDLGRKIIEPNSERIAKISAFLSVPLFLKVYNEFDGNKLPPASAIEAMLVKSGVGESVSKIARQVLFRSARTAGFFDAASDRLVKPTMPIEIEKSLTPETVDQNDMAVTVVQKNTASALHPAFQLLLQTLPEPNTHWQMGDRLNWLVLANSAFNMIYKNEDKTRIAITLDQT
jgi:hypothetical protein